MSQLLTLYMFSEESFLLFVRGKKKKVPLISPILGQVLEAGLSVPTLKGTLGIGEAGDYRW